MRVNLWRTVPLGVFTALLMPAEAQEHHHHPASSHNMNQAGMYLMNMASGTSLNPLSWPMPMWMTRAGAWNLMWMGQGFLLETQQSGARGGDKLYSPNWFMSAAGHQFGRGSILLQAMLSLDPATVTNRSYPLLFQTGETAFGKPLVDAQHPHDFIMELGLQYARPIGDDTLLQLYYAPVGDPALGPVAFPHRASAFELPQAPLGHHWQDSTHIANNVATVAIRHKWLRLEASGFYGSEPNENRWNIDWGGMNSWSARFSVFPAKNWMAQVSAGRLTRPERQEEGDVARATASLHYTRPMANGDAWSTSFIWGQNRPTDHHAATNSFLTETLYPLGLRNFVSGRFEVVKKDELFPEQHGATYRIQAYTAGYTRDIGRWKHLQAGIGSNVSFYFIPAAIRPDYGAHPWGINVYLRFRLKPAS